MVHFDHLTEKTVNLEQKQYTFNIRPFYTHERA